MKREEVHRRLRSAERIPIQDFVRVVRRHNSEQEHHALRETASDYPPGATVRFVWRKRRGNKSGSCAVYIEPPGQTVSKLKRRSLQI